MNVLDTILYTVSVMGLLAFLGGTAFCRVADAPQMGSEGFHWPWQRREYYSPRGYSLRIYGSAAAFGGILLRFVI